MASRSASILMSYSGSLQRHLYSCLKWTVTLYCDWWGRKRVRTFYWMVFHFNGSQMTVGVARTVYCVSLSQPSERISDLILVNFDSSPLGEEWSCPIQLVKTTVHLVDMYLVKYIYCNAPAKHNYRVLVTCIWMLTQYCTVEWDLLLQRTPWNQDT